MKSFLTLIRGALARTFPKKSRKWVVWGRWYNTDEAYAAEVYILAELGGPRRLIAERKNSTAGWRKLAIGDIVLDDHGRFTSGNFFHRVERLPDNSQFFQL